MTDRLQVLNIWVDSVSFRTAIERAESFLDRSQGLHTVFASNPEKNFSVPRDLDIHAAFKEADLLLPDGIGMVMAARILHGATISRVPGADFMVELCRLAASRGARVFFYGGREDVSLAAVEELCHRYPGLIVAGRENGYVSTEEMAGLIEKINISKADLLFLALGSPRQERWIQQHRASLTTVRLVQGVGGTLDTLAGTVKRAPLAWQKANVEWLYRLLKDPVRIKRQKILPIFVVNVCISKIRQSFSR